MTNQPVMRHTFRLALAVLLWFAGTTPAQTADDVQKLSDRLVDLDSIDLCKFDVKYRDGLESPLAAVDADESAMTQIVHERQRFWLITPNFFAASVFARPTKRNPALGRFHAAVYRFCGHGKTR